MGGQAVLALVRLAGEPQGSHRVLGDVQESSRHTVMLQPGEQLEIPLRRWVGAVNTPQSRPLEYSLFPGPERRLPDVARLARLGTLMWGVAVLIGGPLQ
ncbi:MAG TPA: hypothetical protein VES01_05355 [Dermatophilaceae bacterium]|nr:hypothetical protein [Dermatophilaceae bacterium]